MIEKIKKHQNYISLSIALVSLCYIFYVVSIRGQGFVEALAELNKLSFFNIFLLGISLLVLSLLNWLSEAIKWHILINNYKEFSFLHSVKRCLAGHTLGIMTPNKLGDYAAKMFLYQGVAKQNILAANFLNNAYQLLVTLFFGGIGICFFYERKILANFFTVNIQFIPIYAIIFFIIFIVLIFFRKNLVNFVVKLKINKKKGCLVFLLSITKYIAFSQLYVIVLKILGTDVPFFHLMCAAWVVYLLSSLVPTFFVSDLVVKTGVAVVVFSSLGVNEFNLIIASFLTWLVNFIIPALVGNVYVLQLKQETKKEKIIS